MNLVVSSFGIENQDTIDKCMPVRVMGYDVGTYRQQITDWDEKHKIHVFDIAFLEDEVIENFTSDFNVIVTFFKKKRLGENPLTSEKKLKHPYAIMEFISVFTQDKSYVESVGYLENISRTGGAVTMCAVEDALKTEGRREGKLEGKQYSSISCLQ